MPSTKCFLFNYYNYYYLKIMMHNKVLCTLIGEWWTGCEASQQLRDLVAKLFKPTSPFLFFYIFFWNVTCLCKIPFLTIIQHFKRKYRKTRKLCWFKKSRNQVSQLLRSFETSPSFAYNPLKKGKWRFNTLDLMTAHCQRCMGGNLVFLISELAASPLGIWFDDRRSRAFGARYYVHIY